MQLVMCWVIVGVLNLLSTEKVYGSIEKLEKSPHEKIRYQFTYKVEIPRPQQPLKSPLHVHAWVPMPTENHEQKITHKTIVSNGPYQLTEEKKYGNKMIYLRLTTEIQFPLKLEMTYEIERFAAHSISLNALQESFYWEPRAFLSMDRKVPIQGIIAELASKETQGVQNIDQKIERIYRYIVQAMTYSKAGSGWGNGDAIWACSNKRGNCTDFHSLFVGMARSQQVPARFEIGFPIPKSGEGPIPGYHCWARAYSPQQGWIPLDASESKKAGDPMKYFGYFPSDRLHFTTGRDLVLSPRQQGEPLNYFIYPYVEVNGKQSEMYKKEFFVKTLL